MVMSLNGSGANISASLSTAPPRAVRAWFADGFVWIELSDDRRIGFRPDKCPRLRNAPIELISLVQVEARGRALRWEELDEDLTIDGIMAGRWPGND